MSTDPNTALVLRNFQGDVAVIPEFFTMRDEAIKAADAIADVKTHEDMEKAAQIIRNLAAMRKGIEEARKFAKAPVLAKGKEIDETAEKAIGTAIAAEKTLTGKLNHYQAKQLEIQREQQRDAERAAAKAEADRVAAEKETARLAQEQESARQREEQAKIDAENARLAAERANTPEAKALAQKAQEEAAAREQQAQADAAKLAEQQQAAEEEAEAAAMVPLPAAPLAISTPRGVSAKVVIDFTIIGEGNTYKEQASLAEFARAYPLLVKYDIRRQDVLDRLNGPGFPDGTPGIKPYERVKSTVR